MTTERLTMTRLLAPIFFATIALMTAVLLIPTIAQLLTIAASFTVTP